jgi:fatty-acid desaturase
MVVTHITIASVTIYLHRHQAHRALELHPIPSHFFRFWLWLTTGQVTKEWAAIHRKHHAKCDTEEDPHSPVTRGIKKVFWEGAELYRAESKNKETMANTATARRRLDRAQPVHPPQLAGRGVAAGHQLHVFGVIGITVWAVQMLWIPITAAGIINGIGHYWGYRNYDCADAHQHHSLGHADRRRRAAQQPPHLCDFGQAVVEMVRVRYRLGVHPRAGNGGPGQGEKTGAGAEVRQGKLEADFDTCNR